mmetsp:Transcript_28084/g.40673  ORF Transcript_28084/g.40673 Transcript_28084/m.40673 type:complete len:492 (+) Transcript_28084:98-1573(+)
MKITISKKVFFHLFAVATWSSQVTGAYCNWGGCTGVPQGCCDESALSWCNANENQCESGCSGEWCTNAFSYCSWASTCDGTIVSTEYCNASEGQCTDDCGGNWCANGNGNGGGGGPTPPIPTPPTPSPHTPPTPTPGTFTATTTRYWDCSCGACGCSFLPTGLGNEPVHCHSNAMFTAPANNEYGASFYGAAAISASLGGGNWMAEGCGKCWRVTGTSNAAGYEGTETTLVLKGTNFCPDGNPMCGAGAHFDIAAPGFDVTAYSFAHTCPEREPEEAGGFAACENWLITNNDPDINCDCSLFNDGVLKAGCENFYSLKWDNPVVTYEEVDCPPELSALHCGYPYATEVDMPETCASNLDGGDGPGGPDLYCGDGICTAEIGEDCNTCADDCNTCVEECGDGICSMAEACDSCPSDCGVCPPVCGDGYCDDLAGEDCNDCSEDCGSCCGDGSCDSEYGETCSSCATDCRACPPTDDDMCYSQNSKDCLDSFW